MGFLVRGVGGMRRRVVIDVNKYVIPNFSLMLLRLAERRNLPGRSFRKFDLDLAFCLLLATS